MTESFDADWLALREPFDAAARDIILARRFAAMLPPRPRLMDLGAGAGSLFRWLAPIIGRAQVWTFADADADLLRLAFARCAEWGEAQGFAVTVPASGAMLLHTQTGAWRIEALRADIAHAMPSLDRHDGVVCSALLDLVSRAWLTRLLGATRVPLLTCLNVDGHDVFLPRHPFDRVVLAGFRRDQRRDKGFGPALGPRAASALVGTGTVITANTPWHIPITATAMLTHLVTSHADVAARRPPLRRDAIADWRALRLAQASRGKLAIRIGHRDSLVLPAR